MDRTNKNAGDGVATPTTGAPMIAWAGDFEISTTHLLQEVHIARRFPVTPPIAALVAGLAFATGARR